MLICGDKLKTLGRPRTELQVTDAFSDKSVFLPQYQRSCDQNIQGLIKDSGLIDFLAFAASSWCSCSASWAPATPCKLPLQMPKSKTSTSVAVLDWQSRVVEESSPPELGDVFPAPSPGERHLKRVFAPQRASPAHNRLLLGVLMVPLAALATTVGRWCSTDRRADLWLILIWVTHLGEIISKLKKASLQQEPFKNRLPLRLHTGELSKGCLWQHCSPDLLHKQPQANVPTRESSPCKFMISVIQPQPKEEGMGAGIPLGKHYPTVSRVLTDFRHKRPGEWLNML